MNINFNPATETVAYSEIQPNKVKTNHNNKLSKSAQRIFIIDILRGFALSGVLLVHLAFSFSGWSFLNDDTAALLPFSFFDPIIDEVVKFFFSNKFRGIFSFLFGLSFSLQIASYIQKGLPYKKIFYKRMAILLMFGSIHAYFFWHGDILRWYVITGLILLWIHKWNSRRLLFFGIFLSTIIPIINETLKKVIDDTSVKFITDSEIFSAMAGNSYFELLYANFLWDFNQNFNPFYQISFVLVILGQFMLGLWVGKNKLFENYNFFRPSFKRVLCLSLILGIGGTGIVLILKKLSAAELLYLPQFVQFGMEIPENVGILGLASAYICGITLLHDKSFWKNKLSIFIPVGRMALTNYIMQSVLCIFIFYGIGLGLIGQFSLIFIIPFWILIFGFQIILSKWWLNNFHAGPLEWIWRSLMLNKFQPFLKEKTRKIST
jgi:uncharacterized protein